MTVNMQDIMEQRNKLIDEIKSIDEALREARKSLSGFTGVQMSTIEKTDDHKDIVPSGAVGLRDVIRLVKHSKEPLGLDEIGIALMKGGLKTDLSSEKLIEQLSKLAATAVTQGFFAVVGDPPNRKYRYR